MTGFQDYACWFCALVAYAILVNCAGCEGTPFWYEGVGVICAGVAYRGVICR